MSSGTWRWGSGWEAGCGIRKHTQYQTILTARDGKLDPLEKVRTWRKARERLVNLALACTAETKVKRIGMIQVNNDDGVRELHENLKEALGIDHEPLIADFTPGLSVRSSVIGFVLVTD
ncbi:MAG: DegV family protein [Chloroflexota bacterium]|nr:DegV family protein [Chloroflexota bacterium]